MSHSGAIQLANNSLALRYDALWRRNKASISISTGELLNKLSLEHSTVLMGDFNINLLNSDTHEPTANLNNTLLALKSLPMINKRTRITKYSSTLIGNIFINFLLNSVNSAIICHHISDHLSIYPFCFLLTWYQLVSEKLTQYWKIDDLNTKQFIENLKKHKLDWS